MKKTLFIFLAGSCMLTSFIACKKKDNSSSTPDTQTSTTGSTTGTPTNTNTCNFTALTNDTYSYGTTNGILNSHFNFASGANWQMSARETGVSPSNGIGIQFPVKPTANKTYIVTNYGSGQVSGTDSVFVYVSQTVGSSYTNDNGIAGGCLNVTITGGKITASFKDLTLASGKKLSATIVEP